MLTTRWDWPGFAGRPPLVIQLVALTTMKSSGLPLRRGKTAAPSEDPLVPAPAPRPVARAVGLATLVQVGASRELPIQAWPGVPGTPGGIGAVCVDAHSTGL